MINYKDVLLAFHMVNHSAIDDQRSASWKLCRLAGDARFQEPLVKTVQIHMTNLIPVF